MSGRRNQRLNIPIPSRQGLHRLPLPAQSVAGGTAGRQDVEELSDLERLATLGYGSGGVVYKVRHKKTSAVYALKLIHGNHDQNIRGQIIREMEILKKTDSPFVVKCHGIFDKGEEIHFVLEYMDRRRTGTPSSAPSVTETCPLRPLPLQRNFRALSAAASTRTPEKGGLPLNS